MAKKLTPIEREIKTRRLRIEKAHKRVEQIKTETQTELDAIKFRVDCDQAVLDALLEAQKN